MNAIIEMLNHAGGLALGLAWPMFWQSSLLIALLYALDYGLRRKLQPAVRYALWLLLLVKLVLPPSLALPTSPTWWLRAQAAPEPPHHTVVVVNSGGPAPTGPAVIPALPEPAPGARLSLAAMAVLMSALGSVGLLAVLVIRWRQVTRAARDARLAPDWLRRLMEESRRAAGVRTPVPLKQLDQAVSPAVCGLVWPVVLVPGALLDRLSPPQARAILLHELIHLRRGDIWVNCLQTLLQVVYWWHPLLWLANARIRGVREEAVDEAVLLALRGDAGSYASTLLEVARLALPRPLASLGLVGILESQRSLRRRIERLLDLCPPRKAKLTLGPALCVLALGAFALPMGQGPSQPAPAPLATMADSFLPPEIAAPERASPAPTNITAVGIEPQKPEPAAVSSSPAGSAVVSSALSTNEVPPLYTRVIEVDPNSFVGGLRGSLSPAPTNDASISSDLLRRFFATAGVDLAPPKTAFFNDREGVLLVRATLQDLDRVETAIQAANAAPRQLNIKARFIAVADDAARAFWTNREPANIGGTNRTTILTPAQADASLKTLRAAPNTDLLHEPSVTTLSGRQTQVQSVELMTVVTNLNPRALTPPGISSNAPGNGGLYLSASLPFGPTLDIVPRVDPDGWTIQVTIIASLAEFLGYDPPSNTVPVYVDGRRQDVLPPLPHFRVGQVTQAARIPDGHTLVLGGITNDRISIFKSQIPVLGDLPILGRLFRRESKSAQKRQVLVFVTPTLIDRAGNRIHEPETAGPGGR